MAGPYQILCIWITTESSACNLLRCKGCTGSDVRAIRAAESVQVSYPNPRDESRRKTEVGDVTMRSHCSTQASARNSGTWAETPHVSDSQLPGSYIRCTDHHLTWYVEITQVTQTNSESAKSAETQSVHNLWTVAGLVLGLIPGQLHMMLNICAAPCVPWPHRSCA